MGPIERYRAEFPHIAAGIVHLNHAGVSGLNQRLVSSVSGLMQRQSVDPAAVWPWLMERMHSCRAGLARLMGVPGEHVALTKNTAHGLSILADGLRWRDGDEVVFADCEYPANSYPWLAQQDRGVRCITVPTPPDGMLRPEHFDAAMGPRTRVVAVSWVQFSTGFRCDLAALADLAHARGALLVVDVIQGLGALPVDLTSLGVDAAATGSQKWLLGPVGVGALYARPAVLEQMRLVNMGAGAVRDVAAFDTLNLDVKPTVQRYEEGTPNALGIVGLDASIGMIEEAGIEQVSSRILAVTRAAMDTLRSRGYIVDSPEADQDRAGIVMFHHRSIASERIAESLGAHHVNVAVRAGRVRFAPHFFNDDTDIDRAIAALPA